MLKLNALQVFVAFGLAILSASVFALLSVNGLSTDGAAAPRRVDRAKLAEVSLSDRTADALRIKAILAPDSALLSGRESGASTLSADEIAALSATPPEVIATGMENGRSFALLRGGDANIRLAAGDVWNGWTLRDIRGVAAYFSREGQDFDHVFFAPSDTIADDG